MKILTAREIAAITGGEILCGECKVALTQKINVFLEAHQAKREEAKEIVDKMTFEGFKW